MYAGRFSGGLAVAAAVWLVFGWVGAVAAQEAAYGSAAAEIADRMAAAFPKVAGQVIGLEKERILLDLGAKDAVIAGLELQAYREGQEFKHPYTGQILGKLDRDVGRVRIVEVQPNFSVAEIIQQTEGTMVQQGDKVRVTSARVIVALPNVDVTDVAGANTRSVTRDLTNALIKTNRFEVMPDQRIRAALAEEKLGATDQFADPAVLQALWKRLRVTAVLLAKLSLLEKAVRWDVQVLSTVRGDTITLASAEVKGAAPKVASTPARGGGNFAGQDAPRIDQVALRSQEVPFKGRAMAAGEFTGDGTVKLAITDGQGVFIYDVGRNGVTQIASIPGLTSDNVIALDAADINGNGLAEIFVTNVSENAGLRSYVLEYQNGKYVKIWQDVQLHFRVMAGVGGGLQLFAQTNGDNQPFDGPVRRYTWQGSRYAPTSETVPLPKAFPNLYGFALADVDGDGAPEILVLDNQDYLRVFDRSGGEIYRSSDHFGGTELTLAHDPTRSGENPRSGIQPKQIMLQGRMFYQDIMGDGKKQLVLPRNTPSTGYIFQTRMYDKGKVLGLGWDGAGMQPIWETREVPGYIADFALMDPEGSGNRKVVLLVVQTNLIGMATSRTSVIILDLKPQG
jgi:Flagellar assembly protein T, C-terminal domain